MLDRAFKYILSALQVHLLLMGYIIHLLLSTIHHFRIGERSGLLGLIRFGQGFVSRMKAEMSHLVVTKAFLSVGWQQGEPLLSSRARGGMRSFAFVPVVI